MENQNNDNLKEVEGILDEESAKASADSGSVMIAKSKISLAKKLLANIKHNSEQLIELLGGDVTAADDVRIGVSQLSDQAFVSSKQEIDGAKVIEGVFDGEVMIGPDGKQYTEQANYASKSKLVEGDILKLTITSNGTFIYKQIGPIDRSRIVGTLKRLGENDWAVFFEGRSWRVLNASVTYFKGSDGDETVILVPKVGESKWAAVENIIRENLD